MAKILTIIDDVEKALDAVCDLALKHGGLQAFHFVKKLAESVTGSNPATITPAAPSTNEVAPTSEAASPASTTS